jgi:hypothetical protein
MMDTTDGDELQDDPESDRTCGDVVMEFEHIYGCMNDAITECKMDLLKANVPFDELLSAGGLGASGDFSPASIMALSGAIGKR